MRALAHIGALPSLYNLHITLSAYQVFGAIAGEKFCVDIDNSAIRYYSEISYFLFYFILFIQVLVIWSLCLCV